MKFPAALAAWTLLLASGAACGVAFSPGTKTPAAPEELQDDDIDPPTGDDEDVSKPATKPAPTVGVSVVVGGEPLDSGVLPKPPFPVMKPP